ncbi:MAG TPA: phosphate ABC transporter permease PstA [Tepidisphaeraceae bacterium]|nr:phosphate ABC transporter permease PstA [Tepidisphaeraceae bacterium]
MPASPTAYDRVLRIRSRVAYMTCAAFAAVIVAILVLVTGYLVSIGFQSINLAFFTENPIPKGAAGYPGGMLNGLAGTGFLILLASAVGIPIGMLAGVYLAEYEANSWLAAPVRFIADVLAGVPSIVVGILGYELLVAPIGHYNGYAGALALAFIMIPIVSRTTEEMLRLVPNSYREASVALGATKARTILTVVIPSATGSIVTGIMLAIARVAGETAPLLFTALGSRFLETNPMNPFPSLTVQIFTYATGPYKEQKDLAWAGIIVLIGLIFVLNLMIRFVARSRHA